MRGVQRIWAGIVGSSARQFSSGSQERYAARIGEVRWLRMRARASHTLTLATHA